MMKVKRFGSIVLSAVLLSVFVYWATKRVSIFAFASETPSVRPFVATLAEYHIADGQQKLADTIIFARRSDGATSKLGTFYNPDGSVKVAVRRVEMPDGWIGMVIDTIHAKSTGGKPAANLAAAKKTLLSPPVQCLYNGETVDGTGAFFGQHALPSAIN